MAIVNHINIPDGDGNIYCRKTKKVQVLDDDHFENMCMGCPMLAGSAQGEGVECKWNDSRKDVQTPHYATQPHIEASSIKIEEFTNPSQTLKVDGDSKLKKK